MTAPMYNEIERAYAELEQQRTALAELEGELADSSVTVTAKNRAVEATVDSRGCLTSIRFPTAAFRRMAPAELASLLVETIEDARAAAVEQTVERFRSAVPSSGHFLDSLTGAVAAGGSFRLEDMIADALNLGPEQKER